MPYHLQRQNGKWCVHKGNKGENGPVVPGGCHPTRTDAVDHMRALYANVPDARPTRKNTRISARAYRSGNGMGLIEDGGIFYLADAADTPNAQPDHSTGMMVALPCPPDVAEQLAQDGGLDPSDLHVTLGYMGDLADDETAEPDDSAIEELLEALQPIVDQHLPLTGSIGGIGLFPPGPDGTPVYAPVDAPGINELHHAVTSTLAAHSLPASTDHSFTPHMTLRYHKPPAASASSAMADAAGAAPVADPDDDPSTEPDNDPDDVPVQPLPARPVTFTHLQVKIGHKDHRIHPRKHTKKKEPSAMPEKMSVLLAALAASTNKAPIRLYFKEGERTPDRRFIDEGAMNFNRQPPYPIYLQTVRAQGHDGAVLCGVLNSYFEDGTTKVFDGFLDLTQPAGVQAHQLAENGTLQTWSPDLGDSDAYTVETFSEDGTERVEVHYSHATFLGATLVGLPALGSATLALLNDDGSFKTEPISRAQINATAEEERQAVLVACAGSSAPPAAFFTDPQMTEPQRWVTVTPQGRVFTHVAIFDECHIGFQNVCYSVDDIIAGGFDYATPGHVITREGTKVATGPLNVVGGHADIGLEWAEALKYYDKPEWAVADVCYGVDNFGVWASGALRPTATPEQIHILRASGVSLDAREIGGQLRLLGACSVNVPGLPKLRARILASGEPEDTPRITTLIAAGGRPLPDPSLTTEAPGTLSLAESEEIMSKIAVLESIVTEAGLLDRAFEQLEARIN